MAVEYLMRQPSFADMRFGHWSRILVGQINRGHYFFVLRGEEAVGFLGWALTSERNAEAWLAGEADLSGRDTASGDCMIINAWQASSKQVNAFIVDHLRRAAGNLRMIYGKRYYSDGRWRPVRLDVNQFVAGHVEKADGRRTEG